MNLAIVLPHLAPSQLRDEVFDIINRNRDKTNNSYAVFFENAAPCFSSVIAPVMNVSELKHFRGRAIHFSLSSPQFTLKSIYKVETILYSYDLDWLAGNPDYVENMKIYRNENLKLITRSDSYVNLLSKYCNKKVELKSLEDLLLEER
jgi:hypothetical protein